MIPQPWRRALAVLLLLPALLAATTVPATASTPTANAGAGSGASEPAAATPAARLPTTVTPTFQRIHLHLDPADTHYTGSVHVDLTVREPAALIALHAQDIEITALTLTGPDGEPIPTTFQPADPGRLQVIPESLLAPGPHALDIHFTDDFGTRAVGLYRAEHQGEAYLFTQFQAVDARRAFPVWDEPGAKIPYQLTLSVPAELVAVTNTPEIARHESDGTARITYARTQPLPSYLLALAVGPFDSRPIEGMSVPGRVLSPKGTGAHTAYAADTTPALLAALEDYFGRPYPYAKLDLLAVPEFWPGAMENAGLVTFADRILLVDPEQSSVGQLRNLARINAHELAHMWFGDLVTMEWWDDLWLNESFADWMAYKIAHRLYPEDEHHLRSILGVQGIFGADARPTTEAIRRPVERPDEAMATVGLAYAKGRAVLAMVEQWLGEETFRSGVRRHIDAHAGGNAEGADLWNALSAASGKDVATVLAGFLDQPGYPLIEVEPAGPGAVRLTQRRFLNHGVEAPDLTWQVPVSLKVSRGGEMETRDLLLADASTVVELGDGVDWVLPDAGAHGYYRWRVPEPMLLEMAGGAAGHLTPAERIAFLGNAAALLDAGALGGDGYLQVLNAFAGDPHPQVVTALLGNLGKVEGAFVPDDLRQPFALYVRHTLRPALERFGLEPRPGEPDTVAAFRPRLLGWLGAEGGDPAVLDYAQTLARDYLRDPASVDPELAGVALALAARRGDEELFDTYRRRFEEASSPQARGRFLGALGAFRDPALQERALAFALEAPLRPNERFIIPGGVNEQPGGEERVYAWLTGHYETIAGRMPPAFVAFLPNVARGCSAERLERAQEFFSRPEHRVDGTDVQLAKVAAQVHDCVNLRRREGGAVESYLRALDDGGGGQAAVD